MRLRYIGNAGRAILCVLRGIFVPLVVVTAACALSGMAQESSEHLYPDVALKDFDDVRHCLKDVVDSSDVTVVTFWASFCAPCLKELPELDRIYRSYRAKRLSVVAINIDAPNDVIKARRYLISHDIRVLVLYDEYSAARASYGVISIPRLFVIDRNGHIRSQHTGFKDISDIEHDVIQFLH